MLNYGNNSIQTGFSLWLSTHSNRSTLCHISVNPKGFWHIAMHIGIRKNVKAMVQLVFFFLLSRKKTLNYISTFYSHTEDPWQDGYPHPIPLIPISPVKSLPETFPHSSPSKPHLPTHHPHLTTLQVTSPGSSLLPYLS